MSETKVKITHDRKKELKLEADVFVVTRVEAEPAEGSFVMLTIHYASNPEEMQPGKQKSQRFLLRDDGAKALAQALDGCVAHNIAEDAINRANRTH